MRVSRVYTDQELVSGSEITLDGQQAHYLSKVLRLKANAKLILFNGDGFEYPSTIQELSKNSIVVEIHERQLVNSESPLYTILGLGLSRGERMDLAIQKCTELGVNEIIPLFTEFSEVKLQGERLQKKSSIGNKSQSAPANKAAGLIWQQYMLRKHFQHGAVRLIARLN
tara:strand:- start:60858 stop:61364 length:507 start_codon:yes stop_codon:yes gene_type:complete